LNSNYFEYQSVGKLKKTLKSNALQTSLLHVKKSAAGKFFLRKLETAPQAKLIKKRNSAAHFI